MRGKKRIDDKANRYEVILDYCTVTAIKPRWFDPVIEIAENFGTSPENNSNGFAGFRKVYKGSYKGLTEILVKGVSFECEGPKETEISKHSRYGNKTITPRDHEMYQSLLTYVLQNI